MVEQWGLQLLYALGRMFLNPLLYWVLVLLLIAGARRLKQERINFGVKVFDYFNEINKTLLFALLSGLLVSLIAMLVGFVFTIEIMLVLIAVTILVSITGSFQLLSPVYTLGITFFICVLLPLLPLDSIELFSNVETLTENQYVTMAMLVGLLLVVESLLIYRAGPKHIYPSVSLGERGIWLGEQEIKRMAVIPFFLFIPADGITNIGPILPYFQLGENTYYIVLLPFIIGTQILVRSELMQLGKQSVAKRKLILSLIVLVLAIASYFYYLLAFVAIVVALIGTEWITYRIRMRNQYETPYFAPLNEGIKVLATLPKSRAEELHILPGEVITKVNGISVVNSQEFYKALQKSGAFFRLAVVDTNNEVRFIQSAFYAEDHHGLGLLFPEAPFGDRHKERYEQLSQL